MSLPEAESAASDSPRPSVAQAFFGLFILFALYIGGLAVTQAFALPIPAAILGLLALLALLGLRRGRVASVRAAAEWLLPLIPLFLIPVCVSMVMTVPARSATTWVMVGIIAAATVVGVVLTAAVSRWLFRAADDDAKDTP